MEVFEMQKEFDELMKKGQELIKKLKENQTKKVERWKPKQGDEFYFVDSVGKIEKTFFTINLNADLFRYASGNCFKTEAEAKKHFNRMLAEQELLDMSDWDNETDLIWSIVYSVDNGAFDIVYHHYSPYRFATEESARKAIDTLGSEKLKLVFRID